MGVLPDFGAVWDDMKGTFSAAYDVFAVTGDLAVYTAEQPIYWVSSAVVGSLMGAKLFVKLVPGGDVAGYGAFLGAVAGWLMSYEFFGQHVIPY